MQSNVDDYFIPDNEVKLTEELDYSRVGEYIRSAEAFSRSTYQSVYIIDYFKRNFLYVSPNPMFLCGLSPEQMMELGYRFYLEYVPEDEQSFLIDLRRPRAPAVSARGSMSTCSARRARFMRSSISC